MLHFRKHMLQWEGSLFFFFPEREYKVTEVSAGGYTCLCDSLRLAQVLFPNFLQVSRRKEGHEGF